MLHILSLCIMGEIGWVGWGVGEVVSGHTDMGITCDVKIRSVSGYWDTRGTFNMFAHLSIVQHMLLHVRIYIHQSQTISHIQGKDSYSRIMDVLP